MQQTTTLPRPPHAPTTHQKSTKIIGDVWRCLVYDYDRSELDRHSFTVLLHVEEVLRSYDSTLGRIARSIASVEGRQVRSQLVHNQWRIMGEMFADGRISWGRIVVCTAFTIRIANEIIKRQQCDNEDLTAVLSTLLEFFAINLSPWIATQQGGWVSVAY